MTFLHSEGFLPTYLCSSGVIHVSQKESKGGFVFTYAKIVTAILQHENSLWTLPIVWQRHKSSKELFTFYLRSHYCLKTLRPHFALPSQTENPS